MLVLPRFVTGNVGPISDIRVMKRLNCPSCHFLLHKFPERGDLTLYATNVMERISKEFHEVCSHQMTWLPGFRFHVSLLLISRPDVAAIFISSF